MTLRLCNSLNTPEDWPPDGDLGPIGGAGTGVLHEEELQGSQHWGTGSKKSPCAL